jgi:hypothetical protein
MFSSWLPFFFYLFVFVLPVCLLVCLRATTTTTSGGSFANVACFVVSGDSSFEFAPAKLRAHKIIPKQHMQQLPPSLLGLRFICTNFSIKFF